MRSGFTLHMLIIAAAVSIVFGLYSGASAISFKENFATKTYCDTLATTALWDTIAGEIRLHPFVMGIEGSYDTPDQAMEVVVSGDYAFVADYGTGLMVFDISDPSSPVLLDSYSVGGPTFDVAVAGDYAFLADGNSGITVVDISNPSDLQLAGNCDTPGQANGIVVAGNYAFVADYYGGFRTVDISNPTSPFLVGHFNPGGASYDVAVAGDYAFVAAGGMGMQVVDISDPTFPVSAGSYAISGANGICIAGDYAYVANNVDGLEVIDISDPTAPAPGGNYNTPGYAQDVVVSGNFAYVADYGTGLQVIDVSDPLNPAFADSCETPGSARGLAVAGDFAYVADTESGLQVIDILDRMSPHLVGSHAATIFSKGIDVAGDYAYIAASSSGLIIADISDPAAPSFVASYDTLSYSMAVCISGDYAFVADYDSGLVVLDITDPADPVFVGRYNTPGYSYDVAVDGDYACVADGYGLQVIDISDPSNPTLAGSYASPQWTMAVRISGDYAFIANDASGFEVIDISNPAAPALLGALPILANVADVEVSGDYAYVALEYDGLMVVDISDPANPASVATIGTPDYAHSVDVSGDYVVVADSYGGVDIIDISDPENPFIAGNCSTPGMAYAIVVDGCHAYVAENYGGLDAIEVFSRAYDLENNVSQSLTIDSFPYDITLVRLQSVQTDSIRWEVSADGGANWNEVISGGSWLTLDHPGSDVRWRATHHYGGGGINPFCSWLNVEWRMDFPVIASITDVPGDQGRQVRIEWDGIEIDSLGSPTPVLEYSIYRRIDDLPEPLAADGAPEIAGAGTNPAEKDPASYPPGDWDYVSSVPADCEETYMAVVETLADSTITHGMHYTVFFIRARLEGAGVHYDSPPDSGYSVDNNAPQQPLGFSVGYNGSGGNELAWEECPDADFQYFRIYRSEDEEFDPSEENLVHSTVEPEWLDTVDEGYKYYYKISAVDYSGNESPASSPETVTGDETPELPDRYALSQNVPNPFNPATMIMFDLPKATHVRLCIYNVKGELVATLANAYMAAGRKKLSWNAKDDRGTAVASGVYFCRIVAGDFVKTRKMVLLR